MGVFELLFQTWMGILTVFTVAFAIGMVVFVGVWAARNSRPKARD